MQEQPIIKSRPALGWRALGCTLLLLVLTGSVFAQPAPKADTTMRVGYSSSMFIGINMTDARNSIKALSASLSREYDIPTDSEPLIYDNVEEADRILQSQQVGAINMPIGDYWLLKPVIEFDRFLVTIRHNTPDEVYVLLAREGSSVSTLASLQGKHLVVMNSPAMGLATPWLDVELAKNALPQTKKHLGSVTESTKPAKVVLPVFFGQIDACLITRRAYNTMVELNPQVGRQLRIIASSPNVIPVLFGFRAAVPAKLKDKTINALSGLRSTVVGRQTLTLFQTEEIIECPAASFIPSLALLDEHARLCPEASAALIGSLRGTTHPRP